MRERFSFTGKPGRAISASLVFLIIWALIMLIFVFGVNSFSSYADDKQMESLERALTNGISQCYAIEGFYPPDIDYLSEHYGFSYDDEKFFIDYRMLGSNLYPDVTVIERNR